MTNLPSDDNFIGRARYAKGRDTLKAIHDATYDIIVSKGLSAASQEAIASRANVSQSTVRHYFPTKAELLLAFFSAGVERLQATLSYKLADEQSPPKDKLLDIVETHYDWINKIDDVYYFESASFWGRNPDFRALRETWYQELVDHYVTLLHEIHPEWSTDDCEATGFQLITLVLGAWTTMGNTRPLYRRSDKQSLKLTLLEGVRKLIK